MFRVALLSLVALVLHAEKQPVPYSHKTHLALGLECKTCHKNPDPGDLMGFPAVSTCMTCHVSVKKDSPHIQKLAEAAKQKKEIPWVRVYQIPNFVFFSHRAHTQSGASCATCHGPVPERDVITKEVIHNMGTCMDCHRKTKASNDCAYCHEPR